MHGQAKSATNFVRLDRITAFHAIENGIDIYSGTALMRITALRDDVLRVRVGATGELPEDASWAVLPASRTAAVAVTPISTDTAVGFTTAKLRVSVQMNPMQITVTDMEGHVATWQPAHRVQRDRIPRLFQVAGR